MACIKNKPYNTKNFCAKNYSPLATAKGSPPQAATCYKLPLGGGYVQHAN